MVLSLERAADLARFTVSVRLGCGGKGSCGIVAGSSTGAAGNGITDGIMGPHTKSVAQGTSLFGATHVAEIVRILQRRSSMDLGMRSRSAGDFDGAA